MNSRFWHWSEPDRQVRDETGGARTLYLEGVIAEESWFDDSVTPAAFKAELMAESGPVTVWIHNPGGDVFAAAQIYNMLMEYPGDVTVKKGAAYPESDDTFGQISIGAFKLATMIKVSEELLSDSVFDIASYVAREFGRRIGSAEEEAFLTGNGTGKPTGILNATGGAGVGVTTAGATAITMDEVMARKKIQKDLGADDPQNDTNLKQLDDYDREVERLLKKRQNGYLTDEEQARLNEVIRLRADIQLEYTTGDGGGYDSIRKGVEAEKARLEAEAGGEPVAIGVDLYTDALTAAAQGYQAQIDALNASYRDQYDAVQEISDQDARNAALTELNTRHQTALNAAQAEYNGLVSDYAPEAFQSDGAKQAFNDLEKFKALVAEVQADGVVSNDEIVKTKEFTDTLDEGSLASFLALVAQVNEAGLGDLDLGTEYGGIQASDLLGGYDTVTDFLEAHAGDGFDSIAALFGAAENEAMRVLVDLGLSEEGQTLKDWIDGHESFEMTGTLTGVPGSISITPSFDLSALDKAAIDSYYAENPDKKPAVEMEVGLKSGWENLLAIAYSAGTLSVFGTDGAKLEVSPELLSTISPTDIIRCETDENGGIWTDEKGRPVIVVPKLGTKEAVAASSELANDKGNNLFSWMGLTSSANDDATAIANTLDEIDRLKEKIAALKEAGVVWDENGIGLGEYENMLTGSESMLSSFFSDLSDTDLSAIATDLSAIIAAIQSGELSAEDGQSMLDPYLKLLTAADTYLGTGDDISAGIAAGMTAYGWDTDAETVAQDVDGALRTAFDSHSPANRTKPIGKNIAEGVGAGMVEADFSGYAAQTAGAIEATLHAALSPETMRGIGRNALYGLGYGILSGEAFVVAAIRTVARASVTAAKQELKINSPSAVFRDEVGRMGSRGIGVGFELEARAQARTIQNASRYLVCAAQAGVGGSYAYDNRRTYNYNATSTVQVDKLYVRDEQDIYALAVEIASLTKRRQRGRGLKRA